MGIGSCVFGCFAPVWLVELWRGSKVPIIQIFELFYGIGAILSTIALKPYITGEMDSEVKNRTIYSDNELVIDVNDLVDRRARLMIPTLLIGGCIITGEYYIKHNY